MADETRTLRINVDTNTLFVSTARGIEVNLLTPDHDHPYQGLSFDNEGNLIATKGEQGTPGNTSGIINVPGNAIGDPSLHITDQVSLIGANSTVSRHQHYQGNDQRVIDNDGVYMASIDENGSIAYGCLAYEIINRW